MKRKFYETLLKWKHDSNGKTALLIDGARRVGKSWLAEEFAKREYEAYLLIDFSKVNPKVKRYFWSTLMTSTRSSCTSSPSSMSICRGTGV